MTLPKFSLAFNWKHSIDLSVHPGLTAEKIQARFEEEIKSRSKRTERIENGFEFSMKGSIGQNSMINPGGTSMPGLRSGVVTFITEGTVLTVKCHHNVLTGFFAIITLIALAQCYLFWWWHRDDFPVWTLSVPTGLLVLYFVFYAISTRVMLGRILRRAVE